MSLSFKQYLVEAKAQLLNALSNSPRLVMEYQIKHYCSIPAKESQEAIGFKPNMVMIIEWDVVDDVTQSPKSIVLETQDSTIELPQSMWSSTEKLKKWLMRHTKGERNREHHVNRF